MKIPHLRANPRNNPHYFVGDIRFLDRPRQQRIFEASGDAQPIPSLVVHGAYRTRIKVPHAPLLIQEIRRRFRLATFSACYSDVAETQVTSLRG